MSPITIGNNVYTGPGNDNVHISKATGLAGLFGMYDVNINGQHQLMTKQQLESTNFKLGGGIDTLAVDSNFTARVHADAGSGNATLTGSRAPDRLTRVTDRVALYGRGRKAVRDRRGGD